MTRSYDLVIVGTGAAATTAAMRVRDAGWTVAVIDCRPFGGTCVLRGCDPKKVLVGVAAAFDHAGRLQGKGMAGEMRVDWRDLMAFKRGFTEPVPRDRAQRFADSGIDAYHGRARFTSRNGIDVDGESLEGRYILLAAGAEPIKLGIPGEEHLVTSDDFLELESLPRRITLVGGGYIAAEFSHIAARAGAEVTILQRGERMLEHFDPDVVGWLMESFRHSGIDVRTRTTVQGIERKSRGYVVRASGDDGEIAVDADLVVHAAGRAPALDALAPDKADIAMEEGRLRLNEYLQSASNPAVYAAGDAAQQGPPLTPVSSHDAEVVAANLLDGNHRKPDYRGVPSAAFSIPPIAAVGLGEAEARKQGLEFHVHAKKASGWFTARQAAQPTYGFKVLVAKDTGAVLGAHLVGPHAEEVINVFALAVRQGITAGALKSTMFAYPTAASDIGHML
ncbi:MAG TPA: NAD(P)/FAD-dependent oxidoreductase [Woeseiaceae bacterium]|nr:NAD(P)/FAD-dependent oxidoreductase [Woeseiaceae bacterium]